MRTTRVCGLSHEPVIVKSSNVTLFAKGSDNNSDWKFNITLIAW